MLFRSGGLIIDNEVKWDVKANVSYNYNRVKRLNFKNNASEVLRSRNQASVEGYSVNEIFAVRYAGLDEKGNARIMKSGSDKTYATNMFSSFTVEDLKSMGSATPPVFGSFETGVFYKNFRLDALMTYKIGHKIKLPYSSSNASSYGKRRHKWNGPKYRWINAGDEKTKMIPKFLPKDSDEGSNFLNDKVMASSDYFVDEGDIVRLKTLSLSYNFDHLLRKSFIKRASLKVSGENLWFWAANKYDLDSDNVGQGFSRSYNGPMKKTYHITLNLNF